MEQRDYFNGIYIAEDSDGIVYRWLIHRGELSLLPESDYGTELIDLLDLNIKKFRLAIYEIKKLCKFDVMKGDIIGVDDVNAVLTKSQELARNISNSREVTGELLLAAIANASAITDDHTAMYFLNIMRGAVEALEELPYIVKKIYGLMYDCVEFDDPKEWYPPAFHRIQQLPTVIRNYLPLCLPVAQEGTYLIYWYSIVKEPERNACPKNTPL